MRVRSLTLGAAAGSLLSLAAAVLHAQAPAALQPPNPPS